MSETHFVVQLLSYAVAPDSYVKTLRISSAIKTLGAVTCACVCSLELNAAREIAVLTTRIEQLTQVYGVCHVLAEPRA